MTLVFGWSMACHAGPEEPVEAPAADVEAEPRSAIDPDRKPADVDTLTALLKARHVDDLPGEAKLVEYASAEESLRYIAAHGDTMLLRVRALSSLRYFDSSPTGELLAGMVADEGLHPALRAAAVTGLAGQPLEDQPERLALVVAALRDRDPRVGLAAVDVLDGTAEGRKALRSASRDEGVPQGVRDAIDRR